MSAADRWRAELEAWVIPQRLLDAAEESPYGWSPWIWERMSAAARSVPLPITVELARRLAGEHGSVLDVGAGRGRVSLPLAVSGHDLTAVEPDAGMADGFEEEAARLRRSMSSCRPTSSTTWPTSVRSWRLSTLPPAGGW